VLELRLDEPGRAVAALGRASIGDEDIFTTGSTVTVVLRDRPGQSAVDLLWEESIALRAVTTRRPTFDDVYLRLTGDRFDAAGR
jgi:hypothetical protein